MSLLFGANLKLLYNVPKGHFNNFGLVALIQVKKPPKKKYLSPLRYEHLRNLFCGPLMVTFMSLGGKEAFSHLFTLIGGHTVASQFCGPIAFQGVAEGNLCGALLLLYQGIIIASSSSILTKKEIFLFYNLMACAVHVWALTIKIHVLIIPFNVEYSFQTTPFLQEAYLLVPCELF